MDDRERRHGQGEINERVARVETKVDRIEQSVAENGVASREHAIDIGKLTALVGEAARQQSAEHSRMAQVLAKQDADRLVWHNENKERIEKLDGRFTGLIWWILSTCGAIMAAGVGLIAWLVGKGSPKFGWPT